MCVNNILSKYWCKHFYRIWHCLRKLIVTMIVFIEHLTHSILGLFYWQATGTLSLIPSSTLSSLYKTPMSGLIVSVHWVYQLTEYKLSPTKCSNTGNVQKIAVLMYLNVRRHMAALGVQSMFLPTPYGGASIEWVKQQPV